MSQGRRTLVALAAIAAVVLLLLGPAAAFGEVPGEPGDPQDPSGIVGQVSGADEPPPPPQDQPAPPAGANVVDPPEEPTDEGDSEGHETENPEKPDHASGSIAEVQLAGEDLITIGHSNAEIEDSGEARGDVVVLALGGNEIIAAHSEDTDHTDGQGDSDGVGPVIACEESGGTICLAVLFADTESNFTDQSSTATSEQALAYACVGGEQTSPDEACSGPIGAGLSESRADITQDNRTGATEANHSTTLLDVCLGPTGEDPVTDTCSGIGLSAVHAESHSTAESETANGTTERSSYVAAVEVGGDAPIVISDPGALALPPGCPEPSLVCLFINQGEGFVYVGGGASRQEAVHVGLLAGAVDGADVVGAHLGTAETLAENTGPVFKECPDGTVVRVEEDCPVPPTPPQPPGDVTPRGLAVTGLDALIPLAVGLNLVVGGSGLVAWDRRRRRF